VRVNCKDGHFIMDKALSKFSGKNGENNNEESEYKEGVNEEDDPEEVLVLNYISKNTIYTPKSVAYMKTNVGLLIAPHIYEKDDFYCLMWAIIPGVLIEGTIEDDCLSLKMKVEMLPDEVCDEVFKFANEEDNTSDAMWCHRN